MYPGNRVRITVHRALALIVSLALLLQSSPAMAGPAPRASHGLPPRPPSFQPMAAIPTGGDLYPVAVPAPLPSVQATPQAGPARSMYGPIVPPLPQGFARQPLQRATPQAPATGVNPSAAPGPRFAAVPAAIVPPGQEHLLRAAQANRRPPGLARLLPAASIPLGPSWNLVSIPEIPTDTDPAAVLASIAGSYDLVYAYDACDGTDPWKLYDPNAPVASDLTAIDHTMGLWIHMSAGDTLAFADAKPSSTSIQLCTGWTSHLEQSCQKCRPASTYTERMTLT